MQHRALSSNGKIKMHFIQQKQKLNYQLTQSEEQIFYIEVTRWKSLSKPRLKVFTNVGDNEVSMERPLRAYPSCHHPLPSWLLSPLLAYHLSEILTCVACKADSSVQ